MRLSFDLTPDSPWADLIGRFGAAEVPAEATLTDRDDGPRPRLLLHRAPDRSGASEIGFYLEDAQSRLVEISPGPAATRRAVAAAWEIADALGLDAIRLAPGEPSLLARLRGLVDDGDDDLDTAAVLAVAVGDALESGVTGGEEADRILAALRPGRAPVAEILNAATPDERARRLERARTRLGLVRLPAGLRRELRTGTPLAERRVELRIEAGLARLRLVRPRALNALDPEMLAELDAAWREGEEHPATRAMVLEASGPAFMTGVDLDRILAWMESDRLDAIEDFVRAGHRFLDRVDRCPHPTLVRLHGLALGAGAEICAAVDTVVASRQGSVGFPELSIGIYPAMGGTQRLPRRIGVDAARWWILQAALLPAWRAAQLGMVDVVVDESELDAEILRRVDRAHPRARAAGLERAPLHGPDSRLDRFASRPLEEILDPGDGADPLAARLARDLRRRSPVAVRTADTLLGLSHQVGLRAGLAAELEGLQRVYPTVAALSGIRASLDRTRRSRGS